MWDKVKDIIGGVAPTVAGLIGGKGAENVVSAVAGMLGCSADPKSIEEALLANPDKLVELKKYEMDHEVELLKQQVEIYKVDQVDRSDARKMRSSDIIAGLKDWLRPLLTIMYASCLFYVIIRFIMNPIEMQSPVLMLLLGTLLSEVARTNSFWFGSSKGSQDKDVMIAKGKE